MIRGSIGRGQTVVLGLLSVVLLLALYTWLSHRQHQENPDDTTIPSWTQLSEGVQKIIEPNARSGERWLVEDSKATLNRFFLGLFTGIVIAVVLGILMGCYPRIEAFLWPPLSFLAKVPPTAALAVFFVMVGTETKMFVSMIAFGIIPIMAQSIYLAVSDIPRELLNKAATLGASRMEMVWNVVLRIVWPRILDAVRLQIGPAMVYLIAAEMVVGDVGFGYRIRLQSRLLSMDVVYPYLALLATFGFFMDFALRKFQHWTSPWFTERSGS